MAIITRFIVATEQGVNMLSILTRELAIEKYASALDRKCIDSYIDEHFNHKTLIGELNNMSNQWLVTYVDDTPAGYARITSKGKKPSSLDGKKTVRIADFGVLKNYPDAAVTEALLGKCLEICRPYDHVWINEYIQSPLIGFFISKGFVKQDSPSQMDELPLMSVCLIA